LVVVVLDIGVFVIVGILPLHWQDCRWRAIVISAATASVAVIGDTAVRAVNASTGVREKAWVYA
jgi:hypothetical protein